jgi:hypothetical protein
MISQDLYEKLKKCLNDEMEHSRTQKTDSTDYYSIRQETQPFESEIKDPKPGPSNINPETGEYYQMPDVTPDEFKYDETTQEEVYVPHSSLFESFTTPEGEYVPPVKGKKTNDPTKIKKSTNFKPDKPGKYTLPVHKPKPDLFVRLPRLPTITESPMEVETHEQPTSVTREIEANRPSIQSTSRSRHELPDFSFSEEHRPLRTSTPLPIRPSIQSVTRSRQDLPDFSFSEEHRPLRTSTPLPFPTTARVQTRKQKQKLIPLQSCKPKRKVLYTEGEEQILDKTNLNKVQCNVCFKFYASKNTLKKHKSKQHNIVRSENQPIDVMQTYQETSHPQQAELEYQQQHPDLALQYQQQHPQPISEFRQQHPEIDMEQPSTTSEQPALEYADGPLALQYKPREKTFTRWMGKRTSSEARLPKFQPTKIHHSDKPRRKKRFDTWNL